MKPLGAHVARDHALLGAAVAAACRQGLRWGLLFWTATVLLDLDHYLHFLWHTGGRDWSPSGMFRFHESLFKQAGRPEFWALEPFHTAEFFLLLGPAAARWAWLRPVFWGGFLHMVVDFFHLRRHGLGGKRAYSVAGWWLRSRALAARGLRPLPELDYFGARG